MRRTIPLNRTGTTPDRIREFGGQLRDSAIIRIGDDFRPQAESRNRFSRAAVTASSGMASILPDGSKSRAQSVVRVGV